MSFSQQCQPSPAVCPLLLYHCEKNLCGSVPAESCKEMACWHHCTGVINSLHKLQLYCLALYFQGLVNPPCHHLMSKSRAVITGLMNTLHTGFHWRNKIPIMAPNLPFFFRHSHLVRHVLLRKPSLFFFMTMPLCNVLQLSARPQLPQFEFICFPSEINLDKVNHVYL